MANPLYALPIAVPHPNRATSEHLLLPLLSLDDIEKEMIYYQSIARWMKDG
jgi:hypothetical protein